MNNELIKINGTKNINGVEIKIIEGGFGDDNKCILFSDVAKEHEVEPKYINKLINLNIDRYTNNDLIDLCDENFKVHAKNLGLITSNGQKHCYILSERGYIKLVSSMANDNEKKWEVMDNIINEYFKMREDLKQLSNKDKLLLDLFSNDPTVVASAHKQLVEIEKKPLLDKIEQDKPLVSFANTITESSDCIDIGKLAKVIKDENIPLGRNKLFQWLRDNNYLMKDNVPYQKYIDNKVFQIKEYTYKTPYGCKIGYKTLVTGKGQVHIVEKLRNEFCVHKKIN